MASFKEMQTQIEQLKRQAAQQRQQELGDAIQKIRELMQEYGLTIEDLQLVRKKGFSKKSGKEVFRNVETGATWSGRGRTPNWLVGQDKEKYRV